MDVQRVRVRLGRPKGKVEVRLDLYQAAEEQPHDDPLAVVTFTFAGELPELSLDDVRLEQRGLTASAVQRFAWKQWTTVADAAARQHLAGASPVPVRAGDALHDAMGDALGAPPAPRRRGPTPREKAFFVDIAGEYRRLMAEGERAPTARLARERGVKRNTMAGWLRRARQLDVLPPAPRGRAG